MLALFLRSPVNADPALSMGLTLILTLLCFIVSAPVIPVLSIPIVSIAGSVLAPAFAATPTVTPSFILVAVRHMKII